MKRDTDLTRSGSMPISRGGNKHTPTQDDNLIKLDPKNLDPIVVAQAIQQQSDMLHMAVQEISKLQRHLALLGMRETALERCLYLTKMLDGDLFQDNMAAIMVYEREAKAILRIRDVRLRIARIMIWNNWASGDEGKRLPVKPSDFGITDYLLDPKSGIDDEDRQSILEQLGYIDDRDSFSQVIKELVESKKTSESE